jgi:hypothetical protein
MKISSRIPVLELMDPSGFEKDFTSIRRVHRTLLPFKDRGAFEIGSKRYRLEAAEAAAIEKTVSKEFAELISATDIGATADVLDRQIIAAYRDYFNEPSQDLTQFTVKRPTKDFRFETVVYSDIENYSRKKDHEGYDAAFIDVDDHLYDLLMWGKLIHVSWKAWRSNRGEILRTLPTRLGIAGKRTIMRALAEQMGLAANRALMYNAGNGNLFDLPLTPTNLETVINNMKLMVDPITNEPRGTIMMYLVVPQTLEFTAERIVNPILQTLAIQTIAGNTVNLKLKLIANPMLDRYTTTGWWLFAQPIGDQGPLVEAYLEGNEAPEVFIKTSDAQRIAGGGPDELGDFRTDNISWKGRITRLDYWNTDLYWMTSFSDPNS